MALFKFRIIIIIIVVIIIKSRSHKHLQFHICPQSPSLFPHLVNFPSQFICLKVVSSDRRSLPYSTFLGLHFRWMM